MKKKTVVFATFLLILTSLFTLSTAKTSYAASNPYPSTQNVDGDGYYEVPCTWFVWQHIYNNLGIALPAWGNGGSWLGNAQKSGYATGQTAVANSIAVWSDTGFGHVAFVSSVSGSNMTICEGGRVDLDHTSSHGVAYDYTLSAVVGSTRSGGKQKLIGFIYLNKDSTPPALSNIRVTDVNRDGYTVTCTVSDHVGVTNVRFPSWNVDMHRGEDANWLQGSISGNTASVRVNASSLKSGAVQGNYVTHIYAYDAAGNHSSASTSIVYIDRTAPTLTGVKIMESDSQGYVVEAAAADAQGINRVQFPTWTVKNGQDDLAANWTTNSAVTGAKNGDAYRFRVNVSEHNNEYGLYVTHVYAFDAHGNSAHIPLNPIGIASGMSPQSIVKYNQSLISVFEENLTWDAMTNFSNAMKSNLTSIPDSGKQDVVAGIVANRFRAYYFIGGYQWSKNDLWKWLSGERFTYQNWDANQPDCYGGNEFYLSIAPKTGRWNDLPANYGNAGFVIETPLDIKPIATITNGNKVYEFYDAALPYTIAKRFCEENGGCLVSIHSKEENDRITEQAVKWNRSFFIGATDEEEEGTFQWVNGDGVNYTNWEEGEPNDYEPVGGEDYAVINKTGKWNDYPSQGSSVGFIMESVQSTETPLPNPAPNPTIAPNTSITPEPNITNEPTETSKPGTTTGNPSLTPNDGDVYEENDEIVLDKGKILSLRNVKRRKLNVKVRYIEDADYYQVTCGINRSFTKGKKTIWTKNRTVTFKNMKRKTYYVKVRGYYLDDKGNQVYGKWSGVKKVKIRK